MRSKFISLAIMLAILAASTLGSAASPTHLVDDVGAKPSCSRNSIGHIVLSLSESLTPTVYLPFIAKQFRPPLFVGMTARWDSVGYGRGSEVWDAGYHLVRNLDAMTDANTIRSHNYDWYSPDPFGWGDWSWYSYYSLLTLEPQSVRVHPNWRWIRGDFILPYSVSPSNGAVATINGQPFLVSGPFPGYTAFGQPMQFWRFTNKDKILRWHDGGDRKIYIHPGEVTLLYDAGGTRLLIHYNEMRRRYYRDILTGDTIQWIGNLTSTNAWPTTLNTLQGADMHIPRPSIVETETVGLKCDREGNEEPDIP